MKYTFGFTYERTKLVTVEARTLEEAERKARKKDTSCTLCHECSKEAEQSDEIVRYSVFDEEGNTLFES